MWVDYQYNNRLIAKKKEMVLIPSPIPKLKLTMAQEQES